MSSFNLEPTDLVKSKIALQENIANGSFYPLYLVKTKIT